MDRRALVKRTAALADRLRPPRPGIVILIYHRVGADRGGQMNLEIDEFDRQVGWLSEHRRLLTIDAAADELASGAPVEPGVVLSFDDGTSDWAEGAVEVLARHHAPAVMYVATDFVERQRPLPDGCRPISWAGLADLAAEPLVTLGSHTHTHALLDRLGEADASEECDRSIALLGERLGVEARHFAYPKALRGNAAAQAVVRRRFRTATLAGTRPNHAGADLHALARSPIQAADSFADFEAKVAGGMRLEDDLRAVADRVRQRRATV